MADVINILMSGIFHAAILFLVAAGLQVVFGVQKIFNLACGSFYALGAYMGITFVNIFLKAGLPQPFFIIALIAAGLFMALVGPIVERGMLKFIYGRDVHFQLLLTFAIVLIIEDVIRMSWGSSPQSTKGLYLLYGQVNLLGAIIPVYNLVVIFASLVIAALIGFMLFRTKFGKIIRAAAESSEMSEALGISMKSVNLKVFTLGTVLGTLGGALVIPAISAMPDMGVELIVLAFAVVVIGGLGSMKGAFVGALVVGIIKSLAISFYPELEIFVIYLIVIGVLVYKPEGLFGRSTV
ncbi:MAG: branched-chain amino acid ABC transporter permease [Deltaproteobacteria bacterium]|nr:branched-chain amino acid ABC transporter permease [Deltaproteobacteria bacterium]